MTAIFRVLLFLKVFEAFKKVWYNGFVLEYDLEYDKCLEN